MGLKDWAAKKKAEQPTFLDQVRGTGRVIRQQGLAGGMSPLAIRRAGKQVKAERMARETSRSGGWNSKYSSSTNTTEVMLDKNGNPTTAYPHIHIIHDEFGGRIKLHITRSPGVHTDELYLPANASGNQVDAAVADLRRRM